MASAAHSHPLYPLTPAEQERLGLLIAKAAEIAEIAVQILIQGYDPCRAPEDEGEPSNRMFLELALADLGGARRLMTDAGDLDGGHIEAWTAPAADLLRRGLRHRPARLVALRDGQPDPFAADPKACPLTNSEGVPSAEARPEKGYPVPGFTVGTEAPGVTIINV